MIRRILNYFKEVLYSESREEKAMNEVFDQCEDLSDWRHEPWT